MSRAIFLLFMAFSTGLLAQAPITTVNKIILDQEVLLDQKQKRSHSKQIELPLTPEFWTQFESIKSAQLLFYIYAEASGQAQFEADSLAQLSELRPVLQWAQGDQIFNRPAGQQLPYGIEWAILKEPAKEKCLQRYHKKGITPAGWWKRCILKRDYFISPNYYSPVYSLPRSIYLKEVPQSLPLLLRTSAKSDTVRLRIQAVLRLKGKRKAYEELDQSLRTGQKGRQLITDPRPNIAVPFRSRTYLAEIESNELFPSLGQ